jgi:hypothetical protein
LDEVIGRLNLPENFEEAIQREKAADPADRRAELENQLSDLAKRSVKAYELSDPLNTFILQHASA